MDLMSKSNTISPSAAFKAFTAFDLREELYRRRSPSSPVDEAGVQMPEISLPKKAEEKKSL
ncbi:hypothetical protein LXL04_020501 [Taraxacum kok-saghyz]